MQQSPNLEGIQAFIALAECGSFALAGRRLGRDATIVSRRVQSLEAGLGVRLAERSTRKVTLTEAGKAYLERVLPLVRDLSSADREAASFGKGTPRGHLRISIPTSFGRLWLSPLLAEFLADHPEITIEAECSNRYVDVIGEEFDVAIRLGVLPDSRLIARKLCPRRRLVCASPSYIERRGRPETPANLVAHSCLRFTGKVGPGTWEFLDRDGKLLTVPVRGPLDCDDAEVVIDAAVRGLGLMYATDWIVARHLAAGTLVPVLEDWAIPDEGAVYLMMPSAAGVPTKTKAFSDWLAKRFTIPPWEASAKAKGSEFR
ncbi:MAG: LysR family transcriptional regulator [Sphingomonas sp.]